MLMPGRRFTTSTYRYGFNGKENDNDIKGEGNEQDYGMRIYDSRIGKFLSVDPLTSEFSWNSPYAFAENDVLRSIDLEGGERLIITQYLFTISGEKIKLSNYVGSKNGNWKGDIYRESYFFEGRTDEKGNYLYYSENGDEDGGSAMMRMYKDNPAYFKALKLYHDYKQEKFNRISADGAIITGGLIATVLSAGTATGPYMAAFGITSGVFSVGVGGAKMAADAFGKFKQADQIPNSPLGGLGKMLDEVKGNRKMTFENIGDLANTFISLFGGGLKEWKNWDALSAADRFLGARDLAEGIYLLLNISVDDKTITQNAKDFVEIMNQYSKIKQANED